MNKDATKRNGKIAMLPISSIRRDNGTQSREAISSATVEEYAADMKRADVFPPVHVSWLSAIEGLPEVHARLSRVAILNRDGAEVVRQHDSPTTLFYVDPTYTPDSRSTPEVYRHEMTPAQHRKLINALLAAKGKVILSGYANPLYDRELSRWERIEIERPNSAAGGDSKRMMTEVHWLNFTPADARKAAA